MILTCPECATSYFVEDSALGAGRAVRCASCGASWRAEPPPPLELSEAAPPEAPAPDAAAEEALFDPEPASERPAEALPKTFRARAETERRTREAAVQGVIWAGMGAALALLVGVGVVFRSDVVSIWPKAASAYASVGLPVNPVGLAIEDVKFQHALEDGHPALIVSGVLRNIRPRAVSAPPLQIVLLDKEGRALLTRTAVAQDPELASGQSRAFSVSLLDPPMFASDLEVGFAPNRSAPGIRLRRSEDLAAPPAGALPPAPPPKAMVVGPAISEATALPPTSPYALKPAVNGGGT